MKKLLAVILSVMLCLFSAAAFAQEQEAEAPAAWYELSAEDTVLTVRLEGNTTIADEWKFEISNPEALELITFENVVGEADGENGAPVAFAGSFMTRANAENNVSLILTYGETSEGASMYTRVLDLSTGADNKITINAVLEQNPSADWIEFEEDGYILIARLPEAEWNFEIVDPEIFELITCDSSEDAFVASFMASMEQAGVGEIVFDADDGLRSRTVNAFVNESGGIFVKWVSEFEVLAAE